MLTFRRCPFLSDFLTKALYVFSHVSVQFSTFVHLLVMLAGVSKPVECVKDDDRGRRKPAGGPHGPVCPSL